MKKIFKKFHHHIPSKIKGKKLQNSSKITRRRKRKNDLPNTNTTCQKNLPGKNKFKLSRKLHTKEYLIITVILTDDFKKSFLLYIVIVLIYGVLQDSYKIFIAKNGTIYPRLNCSFIFKV